MSLLMDALRKAEQQKQKLAAGGPAGPDTPPPENPGLELLPNTAAIDFPSPPNEPGKIGAGMLPELPARLEDLDEQFIAHAAAAKSIPSVVPSVAPSAALKIAPSPTAATIGKPVLDAPDLSHGSHGSRAPPAVAPAHKPSADTSARDAARQLFEAKHPAAKSQRNFAIVVGIATLLAVVVIGAYFWLQLQPVSGVNIGPPPSAAVAPPQAPPQPANSPGTAVPPAPTFSPPAAPAPSSLPPSMPPPLPRSNDTAEENPPAPPARPSATRQTSPAATPDSGPISVTAKPQAMDPLPQQAYDAFNNCEFDTARATWQKLLQTDPKNIHALHGLAVVAQQHRQAERAADYYQRALEADPKDALALAGLISLKGPTDPRQTESRLKTLLAEQPDVPFLNFALGNLYTREARWGEAQQAYFKAHVADPGNPDYLFNLAVSLDQLRQPRLAAQYYNQALTAATQRPAGFDPAQAATRLKTLQP